MAQNFGLAYKITFYYLKSIRFLISISKVEYTDEQYSRNQNKSKIKKILSIFLYLVPVHALNSYKTTFILCTHLLRTFKKEKDQINKKRKINEWERKVRTLKKIEENLAPVI